MPETMLQYLTECYERLDDIEKRVFWALASTRGKTEALVYALRRGGQ